MKSKQSDNDLTLTRRGVMKTTAVGVGSAATVTGASKLGANPIGSASAVAPVVVGAAAGAAALGYLMNEAVDVYTGSKTNYDDYVGKDAIRRQIYEDALEAKSVDERVMTSIENNIESSKNVALAKGKSALVKALNNSKNQTEANNLRKKEVENYYTSIQKNILTHFKSQRDKILDMISSLASSPDISGDLQTVKVSQGGGYVTPSTNPEGDYYYKDSQGDNITLANGESVRRGNYFISWASGGNAGTRKVGFAEKTDSDGNDVEWFKISFDGSSVFYGFNRMYDAFQRCADASSEVNSQLEGFTSDLYSQYQPGDIQGEDVLDPITASTELGNNTGLSFREAQAGMMGIPTSAGFSLRLELQDDSGNAYEVDAEIYTNAQPNDSDGNPAGFAVGETYDPQNFDAPIYVSYEYIDEESGNTSTNFTQLENPFTVLEATNSEGEEVQEVTPTSQTNQTADVSKLEEELKSIREEQQRLLEKSQEPTGGAGGGFFGGGADGIQNLGLVAAGGAVIALLLGNR